jgi:peptide deformylase
MGGSMAINTCNLASTWYSNVWINENQGEGEGMMNLFINRFVLLLMLTTSLIGCATMKKDAPAVESQDKAYFNNPNIVQNNTEEGDRILRSKNTTVRDSMEILELSERMRTILIESKAVGLAAPQIGVNKRVAVIKRVDKADKPIEVVINPEILWMSDEKEADYEGCLSVREGIGKVARSTRIKVRFQDMDNRIIEDELSGMAARIFLHEYDHLNGVLFIDKKTDDPFITLEEYLEIKKMRAEKGLE